MRQSFGARPRPLWQPGLPGTSTDALRVFDRDSSPHPWPLFPPGRGENQFRRAGQAKPALLYRIFSSPPRGAGRGQGEGNNYDKPIRAMLPARRGSGGEGQQAPPQPFTRLARNYQARVVDRSWIRGINYFWVLVAIAAGFALRVNRLGVQSLWNDEGTSVALARLSLPAVISGAAHDIHPPLYYLLLHYWMTLAGDGEFGLRFLSVLAGVLLVAVTFRVARMFFDQEVAIIAAFLSAVSAFQLYYSQETRMYVLVALWCAFSVWSMARLLLKSNGLAIAPWLAYLLTTIAALYTHYFAFTLVLFENLAFLTWLIWVWLAARGESGAPLLNPSPQSREKQNGTGESEASFTRAIFPIPPALSTQKGESRGEGGFVVASGVQPSQRSSGRGLFIAAAAWIAAQFLIVLAFLPWLVFAGNQLTTWPAISAPISGSDLIIRVLSAFILQIDAPIGPETWIVAAYGIFFLVGLLPSLDLFRQSAWGIGVAALWALVPLIAMYAISLQRPDYDPKFLLLATPGFFIIAARGLSMLNPGFFLRERARRSFQERNGVVRSIMTWQFLFTFGIVTGGAFIAIRDVYYDPRLQRDDYREIARYIDSVATAQDAVLVDAPGQIEVFRYYYHGPGDVQTLPIGRPLQLDATRSALEELTTRHRNLYAVFWATEQADPDNVVEKYLSQAAFKAGEEWRGNVRFAQYSLPSAFVGTGPRDSGVIFGNEIELVGYQIGAPLTSSGGSAQATWARPGSIVPLELRWTSLATPAANYKVFIHLLDASGKLVSQRDTEPVSGFEPTTTWKIGDKIQDLEGLLIPPATPAGKYSIELGLYRPEDGTRLRLASGDDRLVLDSLVIQD